MRAGERAIAGQGLIALLARSLYTVEVGNVLSITPGAIEDCAFIFWRDWMDLTSAIRVRSLELI